MPPGAMFKRLFPLAAILGAGVAALSCSRSTPQPRTGEQEITVAAASNLTGAFEELARQFTAETGIKVTYSFGATADLARQVEQGAPFDVFASADVVHVAGLEQKGFVAPGSAMVYARGRLVVWAPPGARVRVARVEGVAGSAEVRRVAVANPELAPYGRAAVEALQALNVWPQVETKIVYAQNVSQARQFAASGNAEAAFIPLALVKQGEGSYVEVDESLHRPIEQAIGLVHASGKQEAARAFVDYVTGAKGQALLEKYGYRKPPAAP